MKQITEKKDEEISESEKIKNNKKSQTSLLIIVGIILLIVASFLIYQNYKSKINPIEELNNKILKGDAYFYNVFLFENSTGLWLTVVLRQLDKNSVKIRVHC